MSFPRYPAYKDSGVEWLGQVPSHWKVSAVKFLLKPDGYKAGPFGSALITAALNDIGGVLVMTPEHIARQSFDLEFNQYLPEDRESAMGVFQVQQGDVVLPIVGTLGRAMVIEKPVAAILNQRLARISPDPERLRPRLLKILLTDYDYFKQLDVIEGKGAILSHITKESLINRWLAVPPLAEQDQILTFLENETAKIDALVAEQEQLITLLKEKRQAVISHAVTKGLDPSVPMKDSGVEWLGEVPAHWGIGKVKQFFATTSGSTPNTDRQDVYYNGEIPWIRSLDLTDGDIVEWEVGITPAAIDDTACKLLPVGTVLVAMYGGDGTIGKNGLLRIPAATNQAICALLPSPRFEPEFVLAFMQHQRPYWMVGAEGTRKDPNISQDRVRNALMPCPPLREQRVIVEQVKQALSAFGLLEKEAEAVIGVLNERRSALISAAVTGQIDVRGLAPAQEQAA